MAVRLLLGGEVLELLLGVGFDRVLVGVRVPVGRADLSVLLKELERLDESEGLLNRATDGEVVDGDPEGAGEEGRGERQGGQQGSGRANRAIVKIAYCRRVPDGSMRKRPLKETM